MEEDFDIRPGQYYAAFRRNFSGVLAALGGLLPVASLIPVNFTAYLFPPLGVAEIPARLGVVLFAFLTSSVVFFAKDSTLRDIRKCMTYSVLVAVLSFFIYVPLYARFVRRIEIPSKDTTVQVSVGYARTQFAWATFGPVSDEELLRQRGTEEEQIERLWTARSLAAARLALLIAYSGVLLAFVATFCLGLIYQLKERPVHRASETA